MRAKLYTIEKGITMIDDAGESTCYVVEGSEKAAVIDTVNGCENLYDIVRTVTDKPLIVINTHGHIDHIMGNLFFDEAYCNQRDWALYEEHFAMAIDDVKKAGGDVSQMKSCPIKNVDAGDVFDLGGRKLEVLAVPGHTKGTIVLLDREDRILFSGDAMNGQIWMQLEESTSVATLAQSLDALQPYEAAFDRIYSGHGTTPYDIPFLHRLRQAAHEVAEGKTEADDDGKWFGGVAHRHHYPENNFILYKDQK